jgi:hypothetical protein
MRSAETAGATAYELRQAVAEALEVRDGATEGMRDWAGGLLGETPAELGSEYEPKPRLCELTSVAAAVAVSSEQQVARHITVARTQDSAPQAGVGHRTLKSFLNQPWVYASWLTVRLRLATDAVMGRCDVVLEESASKPSTEAAHMTFPTRTDSREPHSDAVSLDSAQRRSVFARRCRRNWYIETRNTDLLHMARRSGIECGC